jgi:hypothetical protein
MLIAFLIILAGVSFGLGLRVLAHAMQHLAPGASLEEVRALSKALSPRGAAARNPGAGDRLRSLFTPRGWQLRQLGFLLLLVCAVAMVFLVIQVVSLMPSIWHANVATDATMVLWSVAQTKPSIFLAWLAALVLAWLGFVGARFSPWLVVPLAAAIIIWSHYLTGILPSRHAHIVGTPAERSYARQVLLGTVIGLFATAQGMRSWMVRANKRAEGMAAGV